MQVPSRLGSPHKTVILTAGLLAVISVAAAMAPEPIVGPPIAIGETGAAVADPLVPVPAETPCVVTLYTADSATGTFDDYSNHPFSYTPPAGCAGPWNKVVFKADYNVTMGRQYDRTASVGIGGVNLYFGTTQEPSSSRSPSWHVERDVTDLSTLLEQPQQGAAALYNIYNGTYNGSITGSAELDFYPATPEFPAPRIPDQVLSLAPDASAPGHADITTDGSPLSNTFTLPTNIDRAYIEVTAQPQSGDEFWYSCGPDAYADLTGCGGTAFREAEVTIDGKPAGIVPISGWVFTGGIDPYLWRPIPGVQTLNFAPYKIDITPFAGLLDNGQPHTISVSVVTGDPAFQNSSQYFDTAATLLLYQDQDVAQLTGALTQDVDSGVRPVQTNTINPDGVHFSFDVKSRHSLITRGYLDTPHGRASSNVVQNVNFDNSQQITSSNTQYEQAIQQSSSASQRSYGRPLDGPANATTNWSFPLNMDINVLVANDDSETQATTVLQNYTDNYSESGPGGHYAFNRAQTDSTADTLNFDASGNFTGPTGQQASQGYTFTDSRGGCYSRSIDAVAGAITQVDDGAACQQHASSRRH